MVELGFKPQSGYKNIDDLINQRRTQTETTLAYGQEPSLFNPFFFHVKGFHVNPFFFFFHSLRPSQVTTVTKIDSDIGHNIG